MVEEKVKIPAILLIVNGALGILGSIGSAIYCVIVALAISQESYINDEEMVMMVAFFIGAGVSLLLGIIWNGVIIYGGLKLKNLERRGLAMAASILSIIPCFSGCCLLGIGAGIYSLVTMNDPDVKASFKA